MHRINDVIVRDGKLMLSDLPFAEGEHVQVVVCEVEEQPANRATIAEVASGATRVRRTL